MDELIIEDKKYISSKQAAKVTGYAKDYIGQLCREGRVPARLVGRNWYVLESAVRDHRFGGDQVEATGNSVGANAFLSSTWESPHYESDAVSELVLGEPALESEPAREAARSETHLQETWKAWFDQISHPHSDEIERGATLTPSSDEEATDNEPAYIPEMEVKVPMRPIQRRPPRELLPSNTGEDSEELSQKILAKRHANKAASYVYYIAANSAVCTMALAGLGTGYFDKYLEMDKRAAMLAGVSIYEMRGKSE